MQFVAEIFFSHRRRRGAILSQRLVIKLGKFDWVLNFSRDDRVFFFKLIAELRVRDAEILDPSQRLGPADVVLKLGFYFFFRAYLL